MIIGKLLDDRYEILEKIGGGGMAIVFKAKDNALNRLVAIKVLRSEFIEDDDFIEKFKREAQSAASLSHPNIVSIYDVGVHENINYIVMEYIKGGTLKELIRNKGALAYDVATNYAIQICGAMENAHKNGIVHRDIKSHNIMLKDETMVKVTDFGIARAATSSTMTNTGNLIGSVHYFSPEQAKGVHTDEKSDIYSFGVVMYEMLTGRLPFEGDTPVAVALKQIQEDPVSPSTINRAVPRSLEDILLKCMEKEPAERYKDAGEILKDLKQSVIMPNGDYVKKRKVEFEETLIIGKGEVEAELEKAERTAPAVKRPVRGDEQPSRERKTEDNEKKERKGKGVYIAILVWVLALAILTGGGYYFMTKMLNVKEGVVPTLVGLSEAEAQALLESKGFTMEVAERIHSKDIAPGSVVSQSPKAGEKNKQLNPVKVVISTGAVKVKVPNLINESYDKVDILLKNLGLVEGEAKKEYSKLPIGTVISQDIEPNTEVDEGTAVSYTISMGPEKIVMENYVGLNIDDVKGQLETLDLILGSIKYINSNEYANNLIVEQSVKAGTEINRKSIVNFTVSKGPSADGGNQTYNLKFELPTDQDSMKVSIFAVQNGKSENVYENTHTPADSPLTVPVTGKGLVNFEIYINDNLYRNVPYKFGN